MGLHLGNPRNNHLLLAIVRGSGQNEPWFLATPLLNLGQTVELHFLRIQAK